MADPTDTSLKAFLETAYDAMDARKGKPRRDPPKALRHDLSTLQDRERFIALCKREWDEEDRWKQSAAKAEARGDAAKRAPASLAKIWVAEYRQSIAAGTEVRFSFPLNYLDYVGALAAAQAEGELELREETVRRILGVGTFDDAVAVAALPAHQSLAGRKPRPKRSNTLGRLIDGIVKRRSDITFADFKAVLVDRACPETTIEEVHNGTIQWMDDKGKIRGISNEALKRRLSRAKARVLAPARRNFCGNSKPKRP